VEILLADSTTLLVTCVVATAENEVGAIAAANLAEEKVFPEESPEVN
jgi:hypothetical protein